MRIGCALALAFSHYASTLAFYFWNENREYYRSRWLAFFGGPVILAVVYWLLLGFRDSLYRPGRHLRLEYVACLATELRNSLDLSQPRRRLQIRYRKRRQQRHSGRQLLFWRSGISIRITKSWVSSAGFRSDLSWIVKIAAGHRRGLLYGAARLRTVAAEGTLSDSLKVVSGRQPRVFLSVSVYQGFRLRHAGDAAARTTCSICAGLAAASAQVRRRCRRERRGHCGSSAASSGCLFRCCSRSAIPSHLLREYTVSAGHEWWFESFYLLVALEHFYLDGLIWSFRRPHVRKTMLPFLLQRPAKPSL